MTNLPASGDWGSIAWVPPCARHVVRSRKAIGGDALQLGPDEWLVFGKVPAIDGPHSIVEVSDRQLGVMLAGPRARDVLAAGMPLDTTRAAFPVGRATRTVFGKVEIVLWRLDDDRWRIEFWRSYADYIVRYLGRAVTDF